MAFKYFTLNFKFTLKFKFTLQINGKPRNRRYMKKRRMSGF